MDRLFTPYVLSTHYTAGKLMKYENDICKFLGGEWEQLTNEQKDQLLDDFIVDNEIRALYQDSTVDNETDLISSFPKLLVQTGEKIVVDCENDFNTWQDEHSGPFSWKSRSQQNLSLADLDENMISKPLAKHSTNAAPQTLDLFPWQRESWTSAMTNNYKSHLDRFDTSPRKSPLEEVNKAFEGSTENIPSAALKCLPKSPSVLSSSSHDAQVSKHDSPSHTECIYKPVPAARNAKHFSGKFPKVSSNETSPNDDRYAGQQLLPRQAESETAFVNPTMTHEYSMFIGQTKESTADTDSCHDNIDEFHEDRSDHSTLSGSLDNVDSVPDHDEAPVDEVEDMGNASTKTGFDFLDEW